MSLNYQQASWRIRIGKNMYVEVSLQGLDDERKSCPASDLIRAGSILKDVGRSMDRVAFRWNRIESPQADAAVARADEKVAVGPRA